MRRVNRCTERPTCRANSNLQSPLPDDNCVDVYSHDLGLLAVRQGSTVVGYNVLVGGGFGNTPSNEETFPALAKPLAFVTPDQVVDVVKAIVKVYRDFGNRSDRKRGPD